MTSTACPEVVPRLSRCLSRLNVLLLDDMMSIGTTGQAFSSRVGTNYFFPPACEINFSCNRTPILPVPSVPTAISLLYETFYDGTSIGTGRDRSFFQKRGIALFMRYQTGQAVCPEPSKRHVKPYCFEHGSCSG